MSDASLVLHETGNFLGAGKNAQEIRKNPAVAYLMNLHSVLSRRNMAWQLNSIARFFGAQSLETCAWEKMDYADVLRYRATMEAQGAGPTKLANSLAAIRGVVQQAWMLGLISAETKMRIESVKKGRGSRVAHGKSLTADESQELLGACQSSDNPGSVRDSAMLALGLGSGLRRAEIISLRLEDLDLKHRTLTVVGKGNKERRGWFSPAVGDLLSSWLRLRGDEGCPNVFCSVLRGTRIHTEWPLTPNAFNQMLVRRSAAAGVKLSPHDLRRTFASRMLEAGADIDTVRLAMGHASITTTQRYDKRPEARVQRYADNLTL